MAGTSFAEQVVRMLDGWNRREGYRWSAAGAPWDLGGTPGTTLHWSNWVPDREDSRGDGGLDSPHGDWNQLVVVAAGDTVEVYLNGIKVNEVLGVAPNSGRIGLGVEFADLFVRRWELLPLGAALGPTITNADLPRGVSGSGYTSTFVAAGGAQPTSWTLADGALPPGLRLDGASGSLAGTPGAEGSYPFVARVTDAHGLSAEQAFLLEVLPATSVLPADGLVLRLESTEFEGAGLVASWSDQSGRGNHVFASGDPVVALGATPAGLPAIVLDGLDDKLERLHATRHSSGLPSGNADRSIFFVARYEGSNASAGVAYGRAAVDQAFGLVIRPSGLLALASLGARGDLVSSVPGSDVGWLTQSCVLATGQACLYKNGAPIAQWNHTYATALEKLVIGAEIAGPGFVGVQVAAVLIYDRALDESERAAAEAYLASKYLSTPR